MDTDPRSPAPFSLGALLRVPCTTGLLALLPWLAAPAVGTPAPAGANPEAAGLSRYLSSPSGVRSTCRSAPSWLEVDGRLGAVRLTRDGGRVLLGYTKDGGAMGVGETFLRVVDLATGRPLLTTQLGSFGQVTDIWSSHQGTRVWLAAERDGRILTVDSRTGDLLMVWVVGKTSSQEGAVSEGDRYLYVTNRAAGTLTVINRVTVGARTVEIGRGVSSVDVWERGPRMVWLTNRERDELVAVSGRTGEIVHRMDSGGRDPLRLRVRPGTDEIWVVHRESRDVVVVDARDRRIVDRIQLGRAPADLLFSPDGREAYVAADRDRIVRIDGESRAIEEVLSSPQHRASVAAAGCALKEATACVHHEGEDPWTDPTGLPLEWLDDQRIVDDRMCVTGSGSRARLRR